MNSGGQNTWAFEYFGDNGVLSILTLKTSSSLQINLPYRKSLFERLAFVIIFTVDNQTFRRHKFKLTANITRGIVSIAMQLNIFSWDFV